MKVNCKCDGVDVCKDCDYLTRKDQYSHKNGLAYYKEAGVVQSVKDLKYIRISASPQQDDMLRRKGL